jgi:hypothetical protein
MTVQIHINVAQATVHLAAATTCTQADLGRVFSDCVTAFNLWDNKIGGNLDQFVTVHSVHKNVFRSGIVDVEQYFNDQFGDEPTFDPGKEVDAPTEKDRGYKVEIHPSNPNQGLVWGYGQWKDNNNTHKKWEKISFSFGFACNSGKWLLTSGDAQP